MTYLHDNPVRAGFVALPEQWLYSSAIDYYVKGGKGLLDTVSVYQTVGKVTVRHRSGDLRQSQPACS